MSTVHLWELDSSGFNTDNGRGRAAIAVDKALRNDIREFQYR